MARSPMTATRTEHWRRWATTGRTARSAAANTVCSRVAPARRLSLIGQVKLRRALPARWSAPSTSPPVLPGSLGSSCRRMPAPTVSMSWTHCLAKKTPEGAGISSSRTTAKAATTVSALANGNSNAMIPSANGMLSLPANSQTPPLQDLHFSTSARTNRKKTTSLTSTPKCWIG